MADQVMIMEHDDDRNISGTASAAGANQLVATPGQNRRIVVSSFVIQNESATATTMILQDGAGHDAWRYRGQTQGASLSMSFPDGHPWELSVNTALVLDLSGANQCGYSIQYRIK